MFTAVSLVAEAAGTSAAHRWETGQENTPTPTSTVQELEAEFRYLPNMWTELRIMVPSYTVRNSLEMCNRMPISVLVF